jgi:hypothetical protein
MGSSSGLVSPNARGHRARGLQRRRRRLAAFSVRSRALARLPLERGRLGGPHRSRAASLFRSPFWNGRDPILKQRIFGLSGPEGNHGEDPKELLVVSRSDADLLLAALALSLSASGISYERLRHASNRNSSFSTAARLTAIDTGKSRRNTQRQRLMVRITARNMGPEPAELLWFRNRWRFQTCHS